MLAERFEVQSTRERVEARVLKAVLRVSVRVHTNPEQAVRISKHVEYSQ